MKKNTFIIGITITLLLIFLKNNSFAQLQSSLPIKVHHVEPLYNDLVRDLGARKGEKEINLGTDFKNIDHYREYGFLAEYEFAPIDRLGLEIETDFSFYKTTDDNVTPGNKLEALRLSSQYSFYVNSTQALTLAIGYTQIFNFTTFSHIGREKLVTGTIYNPFFIVAKRWNSSLHSLIYTGPQHHYTLANSSWQTNWQINSNIHYCLPNSEHFIGLEVNQLVKKNGLETTLRPQMKIQLNQQLAVGIVTGFPIKKPTTGFSSFFRVIYEL